VALVGAEPIDVHALLDSVSEASSGATVLFLGSVRRGPDDGPVASIEYTAYVEMAEQEFGRILMEARDRWPAARCAARHQIGTVPAGQASIAVAAAAPHRREAFDAACWVVDQAKVRLPIWKREQFDDGRRSWREA
jgi:molybdopterin synthase catalytic subunit